KSDSGTERPVRFMFGEGAGYFRLGEDFTGDNTWFGQFNPRVDNWPDLVTTDSAAGTIQFWFGTAQGSFDPGPTLSVGPAPTRVLTTDLDGDGDEDLAFRNGRGYGDEATLVFSKGNGTFSTTVAPIPTPAHRSVAQASGRLLYEDPAGFFDG